MAWFSPQSVVHPDPPSLTRSIAADARRHLARGSPNVNSDRCRMPAAAPAGSGPNIPGTVPRRDSDTRTALLLDIPEMPAALPLVLNSAGPGVSVRCSPVRPPSAAAAAVPATLTATVGSRCPCCRR